jgi:hypothetical protein
MQLTTSYEDIPISIQLHVRENETIDIDVVVHNVDPKKKPIVAIDLILHRAMKSDASIKLALFYRNNDSSMGAMYQKPRLSQHVLAASFDYLVNMGIFKNDTPISLEADGHRCYSGSTRDHGSWMTKRTIEKARSSVLIAKMVGTIKEYLKNTDPEFCRAKEEALANMDNDFTHEIQKAIANYDESDSSSSGSSSGNTSSKRYEAQVKTMYCAFQNQLKLVKYYESLGFHARCGLFGSTYNGFITTMMYAIVKDVVRSVESAAPV